MKGNTMKIKTLKEINAAGPGVAVKARAGETLIVSDEFGKDLVDAGYAVYLPEAKPKPEPVIETAIKPTENRENAMKKAKK